MKEQIADILDKLKGGMLRLFSVNVLNKVIAMLSSMVITRILTKQDYGVWTYAGNLYAYLQLITGLGLDVGALQFGTENHGTSKAYQFYNYSLRKGLLVNTGLLAVASIILFCVALPIPDAKQYVFSLLPFLLVDYIISIGQSVLRSQNRVKEYATLLSVNCIITTIGTCVGALFGIVGIISGKYLSAMLIICYEAKLLREDIGKTKSAQRLADADVKRLWHFSLFNGASSAMNCLVYFLDITLIGALVKNATEVGIYRVGTLIPNALQFIPSSVVISIIPTIIYNRNNIIWVRRNVKKVFAGLFAFNFVLCGVIYISSPLIIRLISGEQYLESVPVLRILTLGYFISGTFRGLSVNLLAAFRRVQYGLFISITSCFCDVLLNYFLILKYGMIGAAYSTLLVDIITAVLSFSYLLYLLRKGTINTIVSDNAE